MGTELPDTFQVVSGMPPRDLRTDVPPTRGPAQQPICLVINELETALADGELQRLVADAAASWLHRTHADEGVHVVIFTPDPKADDFPREVTVKRGALTLTLNLCIVGPKQMAEIQAAQQVTGNEVVSEFKRAQQAIGEVRGEVRGQAKGKALAALQILEHRGMKVSAAMWARAEACTDPEQAERWFKRSFDVERAEDLLD